MPADDEGPALTLLEQVGAGTHTEVWRGRADDGQRLVLKRLRPGAPASAAEELRHEAALLGRLDSPYLVRLRAVVADGERPALVLDEAGGGSLDRLLEARGRLLPGEVVTVGVPLALALAAVHDAGELHGDLRPACVLLTSDGMPLLSGLGRPSGAGATPGHDVRALAALCVLLLTGRAAGGTALGPDVPPELRAVLGPALGEAPGTASALAAALRRSGPALPLRLPAAQVPAVAPPDPEPAPPATAGGSSRGAHARRSRSPLVVLAGAVALAAAAALGWQLGRAGPPAAAEALAPRAAAPSVAPPSAAPGTPTPSPSTTPGASTALSSSARSSSARSSSPVAEPDWAAVLDGLDAARSAALASADPAALAAVDAPGSSALRADLATVRRLRGAGQTAHGLRHQLVAVQLGTVDGPVVRLHVRDVLLPYDLVGPDGTRRVEGRAERAFDVVLTRTSAGLRLTEVRPS